VNSRAPTLRDQDVTPFSDILRDLCLATGARCAALVDAEGETVDYSGLGEPFDIRILAAEWRLVLQHLGDAAHLGSSVELIVRARKKSFLIEALPEGYALVLQLARRATGASPRALCEARRRLCAEAGFEEPAHPDGEWALVPVDEDRGNSRRPTAVDVEGAKHSLEVLGRVATETTQGSEHSYRVRLGTGEERTLVREPFGRWYLEVERWQ